MMMTMVVMPLAMSARLTDADVAAARKRVPMHHGRTVHQILRHRRRAHVIRARTVNRVAAPALRRRARDHLAPD